MTTQAIVESGMRFGPYPAGQCFYIEHSKLYQTLQEGVKTAEFLLLKQLKQGPSLWMVEAKSSSPKPEKIEKLADFIDEMQSKFIHTFSLFIAAKLGRHGTHELPETFHGLDLATLQFRFILVINRHREAWLAPLQDALSRALQPMAKTWVLGPTPVAVLNHTLAQQHGLILPAA